MWDTTLLLMVKHLVNDLSNETFDDNRILEGIVVSGLIASQEYPFSVTYTFDFSTPNISPDPTTNNAADSNLFLALVALKTAGMLTMNQYQTMVSSGAKVKDGDSSVDTTAGFKGWQDIMELGPLGAYKKLLHDAQLKRVIGKAVMSPPSLGTVSPWGRAFVVDFYNWFRI